MSPQKRRALVDVPRCCAHHLAGDGLERPGKGALPEEHASTGGTPIQESSCSLVLSTSAVCLSPLFYNDLSTKTTSQGRRARRSRSRSRSQESVRVRFRLQDHRSAELVSDSRRVQPAVGPIRLAGISCIVCGAGRGIIEFRTETRTASQREAARPRRIV